jgi:hypothetical protein
VGLLFEKFCASWPCFQALAWALTKGRGPPLVPDPEAERLHAVGGSDICSQDGPPLDTTHKVTDRMNE